MTLSPQPNAALQQIVSRARHLLLDFDGPVCSIFAGTSADAVAQQLRRTLAADGVTLPPEVCQMSDPLEIFRALATQNRHVGERAQRELTTLEVQAVATARPAEGAATLITAARRSGRSVAIVSNNSGRAITTYLNAHSLARHVSAVSGRDDPDPAHMKPDPYRLRQAIQMLDAVPAECVLVGDSATDIAAAHAAGMPAIGYANKSGKDERLAQAGADAVVTRLADVVHAATAAAVKV